MKCLPGLYLLIGLSKAKVSPKVAIILIIFLNIILVGQKMFADFLKSEFSDENILFYQACEELKKEKNTEKIEEKARIIYEDFISILSPKEVSLDSRVREIINSNMHHPTSNTFDEAQSQIFTLMARDSYPRFLTASVYKELLNKWGHVEEL
uniref:RGS domain-containing protein n=1 Tax=Rhabditophanes sp. KR3021 TaxID=114890 RepID=A0AC35TS35_9BILA